MTDDTDLTFGGGPSPRRILLEILVWYVLTVTIALIIGHAIGGIAL